jgi:hypothetical protein
MEEAKINRFKYFYLSCYWEARLNWRRLTEKFWMFLAWRCVPHTLRRWIVVRAFADATTGKYSNVSPHEVGYKEVMDRMK